MWFCCVIKFGLELFSHTTEFVTHNDLIITIRFKQNALCNLVWLNTRLYTWRPNTDPHQPDNLLLCQPSCVLSSFSKRRRSTLHETLEKGPSPICHTELHPSDGPRGKFALERGAATLHSILPEVVYCKTGPTTIVPLSSGCVRNLFLPTHNI